MKALSVKQPYASMIAEGHKTKETRTWSTSYRGPLLIVSSKTRDKSFGKRECQNLPYGKAVAIAILVDCRPSVKADEKAACCEVWDGLYSWVLKDVKPLQPFPVRGQLGLFEVEYAETVP